MKRWPLNKAYFWESAPFFRALPPLVVGIITYDKDWLSAVPFWVMLLVAGCSVLIYTALNLALNKSIAWLYFFLVNVALFSGIYCLCFINDIRNDATWFGNHLQKGNKYLARVVDEPAERDRTWKLTVNVESFANNDAIAAATGKAFVYVYKDSAQLPINKDDLIQVPGNWELIKNPGNPFEFDYARFCARDNIYYRQIMSDDDIEVIGHVQSGGSLVSSTHDWCMHQLDVYISDGRTKGLIQAMLLGDEINLDEHLRDSYAATGIIHVIAISGANITLFFILISYLFFWLRHKKHVWIKYLLALPLVWFYVVMSGAAPSAIRAAVMFSVLAIGVMFQKNNNSLNQLFVTAFIMLCAQPAWLFSLGFQLSFLAVLSLILFYTPVYRWLAPATKVGRVLWATVAASIAAEVLVAPVIIYYFHNFPVMFIVANVAAYLFMGVVLILGMLIIVLSFAPAVAHFLGLITTWLANTFGNIVDWLQRFTPRSFYYLHLSLFELALLFTIIGGLATFFLRRNKPALFTALTAACFLGCLFCFDEWTALKQERLIVYNFSKADHIEVIRGKNVAVINTDTTSARKEDFILKPPHAAWTAWNVDNCCGNNEIFKIGGKTVLVLNHEVAIGHFPVDYLIVNYVAHRIDARQLQSVFSPETIVVGNIYNRRQLQQWATSASGSHVNLHLILDKGAFILDML